MGNGLGLADLNYCESVVDILPLVGLTTERLFEYEPLGRYNEARSLSKCRDDVQGGTESDNHITRYRLPGLRPRS